MELAVVRSNHKISPATYTPEMDRKIWRKLPIELLERILSFLPLRTFLYLRSTCKYFRSLIFSPVFLSRHTNSLSSSPLSSFLLLSHPQSTHYLMYDTDLNTWRNLKLPLSRSLSCTPLLSTASCLLCFSAVPDSSNSAFLIYNLLARSSRIVKFPEFPFAFELPTLITNSSGYKLFCLSSRSSSHVYAYVYDSRVRQWIRYDGFHRSLGDSYHQQGVFCNGSLYFGTREPFSVVGFDLNTGKWERLEVSLPEDLTFARLAAGENRLFMFGGIGRNGISKTMKVWELDEQERIWMEVESVPDMMCRKFGSVCYHNYEHIYCFWHQVNDGGYEGNPSNANPGGPNTSYLIAVSCENPSTLFPDVSGANPYGPSTLFPTGCAPGVNQSTFFPSGGSGENPSTFFPYDAAGNSYFEQKVTVQPDSYFVQDLNMPPM